VSVTVLDIITNGYRVLTIIDEIGVPTPEQAQVGLTVLNEMMASYQKNGIRFGWYPQASLTAQAPIQDDDIRNAKLMFVGELARNYGIDLKTERPKLIDEIDDAMQQQDKRSIKYFQSDLTGLPFSQGGLFGPGRV
jgi:hypothetical protein